MGGGGGGGGGHQKKNHTETPQVLNQLSIPILGLFLQHVPPPSFFFRYLYDFHVMYIKSSSISDGKF